MSNSNDNNEQQAFNIIFDLDMQHNISEHNQANLFTNENNAAQLIDLCESYLTMSTPLVDSSQFNSNPNQIDQSLLSPIDCINPNKIHLSPGPQQIGNQEATTTTAEIEFIEKPQSAFRFRTITEEKTHGVIMGEQSCKPGSKCFPTIRIKVNDDKKNNQKFYLVADIYIKSSDDTKPILSPHLLARKRPRTKEAQKFDIAQPYIEEIPADVLNGMRNYKFENFFVVSNSTKDQQKKTGAQQQKKKIHETLHKIDEKYKCFQNFGFEINPFYNLESLKTRTADIMGSSNVVCLGFSIYKKTQNGYELCHGPKLSTPIHNDNKNYRLVRICNTRGNVNGGDEITLIVTSIAKSIIIEEQGGEWFAEVTKFTVDMNVAITFKLPAYGGTNQEEDIKCNIYLVRKDGLKSNPSLFVYERNRPSRKKARTDIESEEDGDYQPPRPDEQAKPLGVKVFPDSMAIKLDQFKKPPKKKTLIEILKSSSRQNSYQLVIDHEDNIFDAMKNGLKFLQICKVIKQFNLQEVFGQLCNFDGDTLLHYACRLGKSQFIRFLIGINVKLYTQNNQKKTPLHLAIESNDADTINIWIELIEHPTEYEHFAEEFKRCLRCYDRGGFNVLHRAIVKNEKALVKAIMKFYQDAEIDLSTYEVLGSGMSILHLAVSERLIEMTKMIAYVEPNSVYYEDYKGDMAIELDFCKDLLPIRSLT